MKAGGPQRTKPCMCPNCGAQLDACTVITNDSDGTDGKPKLGSPSICGYCASLLEFGADLTLIPLRRETRKLLRADHPEAWEALCAIRDRTLHEPLPPQRRGGHA